jgi:hypothetical protein
MQPHEKIFQNTNPSILKMCNLHDAKEVYEEVRLKLQVRLRVEQNRVREIAEGLEARLAEINEVEKMILSEGKTPQ